MSPIQHLYPGDEVASFAIRVLLEISAVAIAALLFVRLFARKNPALRHGVCVCALFCVLLAPVSTFVLQRAGWRTFQIQLEHEARLTSSAGEEMATSASLPVEKQDAFWTVERARSAASLTLLVWLFGTALLLVRLARTAAKVNRLRRASYTIESGKITAVMADLTERDGLPEVPIRYLKRLHSPVVVGTLSPSVILPEKLLNQLDHAQLRSVLAHELAHVRNRDPLIGFVQRFVEASYWPHPLVHLLNRDLVRAREEVCDNAALHSTSAPQYAETLLCVALGMTPTSHPAGVLGLMTPPWKLEERVKGLLDPQRRLSTKMNTRHLALMTVILATGTTVIAGTRVIAAPSPKQQETVELTTHVNSKTHKVSVTAVKTKTSVQRKGSFSVVLRAAPTKPMNGSGRVMLKTSPQSEKVQAYTIVTGDAVENGKDLQRTPIPSATKTFSIARTDGGKATVESGSVSVGVALPVDPVKAQPAQGSATTVTPDKAAHILADEVNSGVTKPQVQEGTVTLVKAVDPSVVQSLVESRNSLLDAAVARTIEERLLKADESNKSVTIQLQAIKADDSTLAQVVQDRKNKQVSVRTRFEPVGQLRTEQLEYVVDLAGQRSKFHPLSAVHPSPTTVYIQGGKIKVVGDQVNVVYLPVERKKLVFKRATPLKSAKPKATKPKPKG